MAKPKRLRCQVKIERGRKCGGEIVPIDSSHIGLKRPARQHAHCDRCGKAYPGMFVPRL